MRSRFPSFTVVSFALATLLPVPLAIRPALAQAGRAAQKPTPALPVPAPPAPVAATAPEYGPAKGTLVIVGGGSLDGTGITPRRQGGEGELPD